MKVAVKAAASAAMVVDSTVAMLVEGIVRITAASIAALVVESEVAVVVRVRFEEESAIVVDSTVAMKVPDVVVSTTTGGLGGSKEAKRG